ncbi:RebB like protein [Magnetospirillum sp. ME-1]|uniref:RebB family R body protein n=1 Tax=Magnetospirillum sp. ME-1 TaxID=1639348 RepID=UPI000A17D80C|nr:RebB family R body protein [Magnetospirillum sp. ME-1]ARJ67660.1 RebB like protein [Magnetospirillum sp. ME-1]
MTDSSTVNPQITDAVTQTNVKVLGEAPAMAMASIYQSMAHSTGLMYQNAVAAQNNQNILAQAATTQGVAQLLSIGAASDAAAVKALGQSDVPDTMLALLTALKALQTPQVS